MKTTILPEQIKDDSFTERLSQFLRQPDLDPVALEKWARQHLPPESQANPAFLYDAIKNVNAKLFPPVTALEIIYTEACNLACTYCFEGNKSRPGHISDQITIKAIDLLFDYCGDNKQVQIKHFGGEPLLFWPQVKACIEYAAKKANEKGISVRHQMTTNGTLLTEEMAKFMLDHRLGLLISLDGLAASHDRHRRDQQGRPTFDRVIAGLHTARKAHDWINIKLTVTPESVPNLLDDVPGLANLGVNFFLIDHATGIPWSDSDVDAYGAAMESLHVWYQAHRSSRLRIECFERKPRELPAFGCHAGVSSITLLPDGKISPCAKIYGLDKRKPIAQLGDAWLGLYNLNQREEFHRCTKLRAHCQQTGLQDSYPGGCFASNFLENGDLYAPSKVELRFAQNHANLRSI